MNRDYYILQEGEGCFSEIRKPKFNYKFIDKFFPELFGIVLLSLVGMAGFSKEIVGALEVYKKSTYLVTVFL